MLSVAEALDAFALAPGFEIQAVASEPLVEDPVAITWDERGRLYVVEMRGFMPDAWGKGEKEPVGAVVRLTDVDGDGVYDEREVLLDKLVLPRAVAVVNDGLLIGEPPNLWLCPGSIMESARKDSSRQASAEPDNTSAAADGAGKGMSQAGKGGAATDVDCSQKRRLGEYGNQPGSVEHAENGLLLALDNWLYNAKSDRRMKLVKGQLIVEQTLFRGQWGITQDSEGQLYYNTNSQLLMGDLFDAQPVIKAGNASAPGLGESISKNDQLFAVRVNTGVNRAYVPGVLRADGRLNRPTSASGMAAYRGDQFPAEYHNDMFVAEPAANAVVQLRLNRSGLKAETEHILYDDPNWGKREFLASTDERFRPVDVAVGPDGALYIVDMYRGIIQDHVFLSDELRAQALKRSLDKPLGNGRIWRVKSSQPESSVSKDSEPETGRTARWPMLPSDLSFRCTEEPSRCPRLTQLPIDASDPVGLVTLLLHGNGWHRDTAQRLLIGMSDDPANVELNEEVDLWLQQMLEQDLMPASLHALWALEGRGSLGWELIFEALLSEHVSIRLAALRAGSQLLEAPLLLQLARETKDKSELHHLTMYLAQHNGQKQVLEYLASRLQDLAGDPIGTEGVKVAASGNEYAFLQLLLDDASWQSADDDKSQFIKQLVTQSYRQHPGQSVKFLDQVMSLSRDSQLGWVATAILEGLARVTRDDGFKPHKLASPHLLFTEPPEHLWPAIAKARQGFTWPGDDLLAGLKPLSPQQQERMQAGKTWYVERCSICHGASGEGIAGLGPVLADSEWVTGPAERLVRIILHGMHGPVTVKGKAWNSVMPGHAVMPGFTDEVASGLMTYLHRAWGHRGRIIEPSFIRETHQASEGRFEPWTAEELQQLDINTHYQRYAGTYSGGGFQLKFGYDGESLTVASVFFNGKMIEEKEGHFRFEPRELRIEFVESDAGEVIGLRMAGQDGLMPRTGD